LGSSDGASFPGLGPNVSGEILYIASTPHKPPRVRGWERVRLTGESRRAGATFRQSAISWSNQTTATDAKDAWSFANPAPSGDTYTSATTTGGACGLSGINDQSTGLALNNSTGVIEIVLWYYAGGDTGTVQVIQGDFTTCTRVSTASWD
jgi:hypothetical protein